MAKALTKAKVASKLCVKCGEAKQINEFYSNPKWAEQSFHDAWCKECVVKFCVNKEALREYCWYNNRKWDEAVYDASVQKAKYSLSTNAEYLSARTSKKRKETLMCATACRQFFSVMNLSACYEYTENIAGTGTLNVYDSQDTKKRQPSGDEKNSEDDDKKVYDSEWYGEFTKKELDYLRVYYKKIEEDFVLDNLNIQDYARKIAIASLTANEKAELMRKGEIPVKEYREALDVFDNLCKSANFAECKRKPGESTGLGNLGEIIARIEQTGALQKVDVKFEKDDIDLIIDDFRHVLQAIGQEGSEQ